MKKIIVLSIFGLLGVLASCGGDKTKEQSASTEDTETEAPDSAATPAPTYDPKRGEGKFENVKVDAKLNVTMAAAGSKIFDVKCFACHKLTSEKLVGPGWAGVTSRHEPAWILNFITNPDAMIDKDPAVQALLELCLVRMPNQNLTDEDARNILEFMRKNDGVKP